MAGYLRNEKNWDLNWYEWNKGTIAKDESSSRVWLAKDEGLYVKLQGTISNVEYTEYNSTDQYRVLLRDVLVFLPKSDQVVKYDHMNLYEPIQNFDFPTHLNELIYLVGKIGKYHRSDDSVHSGSTDYSFGLTKIVNHSTEEREKLKKDDDRTKGEKAQQALNTTVHITLSILSLFEK